MKFQLWDKVVAMTDIKGRRCGRGIDQWGRMKHPAIRTVGTVVGFDRPTSNNRSGKFLVRIKDGTYLEYRPCDIEPLELLIDIVDEDRYRDALCELR